MNPRNISGLFFCLLLISCKNGSNYYSKTEINDTTKVIECVVRSIFDSNHLPGISSLKKNYRFQDSILFTSYTIPLNYLPKGVDTLKFKILPHSEILSLLKADSSKMPIPNYLNIVNFKKTDSSYRVLIASYSTIYFGGGGSFLLDLRKVNDSFKVFHRSGGSIN